MQAPSVFLSFSSNDAALATALRQGLQQRGIDVWKAPESIPPGVEWASAIHAGIQQQRVFLLLWSDAAMASQEVSKEISLASQHRRPLLPLRLTAAMPQGGQAYHLSGTQWLEGQGHPIDALVERLEARIHELVQHGHQMTQPLPAVAPHQQAGTIRRRGLQVLAAALGVAALGFDLWPWSAPNQALLNQRLFWQARWRQLTAQSGPAPQPIGLLPLGMPIYEQLGVQPSEGSVNQAVLAKALEALPAAGPPQRVGLDFILDGPGANPAGHAALADALQQQRSHRLVMAGLCSPNSVATADCRKAADQRLATPLAAAGAKAVSLTLGLNTESQPPLQLLEAVDDGSLAGAIAGPSQRGGLPYEAVIDWSVNWLAPQRLTVITSRQELGRFRGEALLIASDGFKGRELSERADQHPAPQAVWAYEGQGPERFATTLQQGALPGGALQAVWAQTIRSGHWLLPFAPFSQTLAAAVAAALAWWAAGRWRRQRPLVLGFALAAFVYTGLALQVAVSLQRLVPIALPLAAAAGIMALRQSRRLSR